MSRTLKDRPYKVLKSDPTMDRYCRHDHLKIHREKVGEKKYIHTPAESIRDENGEFLYYIPERSWIVNVYDRWAENVDCTLDLSEDDPEKQCYWWLEYYPNIHSDKAFKRLTNGAIRSKVRQQLHTALTSGLGWDEIDIYTDSKYDWSGWWD